MEKIHIKGAKVHNLKNISIDIPKNKLIVLTGLSGSGKSSLAFDTIYAEGQRRYAESLNSYARQFMDIQNKPDVEEINGLSPTIAINQNAHTQNPRSTVGTNTEIYDLLRLLFARAGQQFCPFCQTKLQTLNSGQIIEKIRQLSKKNKITILAPIIRKQKINTKQIQKNLTKTGFNLLFINGQKIKIRDLKNYFFKPEIEYDIDIILGTINHVKELSKTVKQALDLSNGFVKIIDNKQQTYFYSELPFCEKCQKTFSKPEPQHFSFNNPLGACSRCTGLGKTLDIDPNLVIPNPRLTLAEGAIQPWTRLFGVSNNQLKILELVAKKHKFDLNTPVEQLSKKIIDIILYGTDGEIYELNKKPAQYEGVIPNLTTRYLETKSEYIKKEIEQYMVEKICPICHGKRLKKEYLAVKIADYNIADLVNLNIDELILIIEKLTQKNSQLLKNTNKNKKEIIINIAKEILIRLKNLQAVGLGYLNLDRSLNTLSGGEIQRVRLSSQLSAKLTGVIYILDEPSIGLHPKDTKNLIQTLYKLRDIGNTVIVVEHDKSIIEAADFIIDIGPGAGEYGGQIIASGSLKQIKNNSSSITGAFLTGQEKITKPKKYRQGNGKKLQIIGATANNLKNIDVDIPLGKLISVTGVSGSGKSTLIVDILSKKLSKHFYRSKAEPAEHKEIKGLEYIDKIITIDQTPIGRTPKSNPATYTGVFTLIRDLFANLPESKMRGYNAGMFSFNVKDGGRCEACGGEGYIKIPMHFLNDVYIECNECHGTRYTKAVLEIHYNGQNIADILNMTVEKAYRFFQNRQNIREKLQILRNVGLGYLRLGQPATTLSGGEAQRIKLATELSRRSTGKTLYILDEPSTGLHFEDIKKLLLILNQLVDKGNTVLIIEHNLDIIKSSDWIIDLGPEGGKKGGEIVAQGTPQDILKNTYSWTAKYLKKEIL